MDERSVSSMHGRTELPKAHTETHRHTDTTHTHTHAHTHTHTYTHSIDAVGVDISAFSANGIEREILMLPGTRMLVNDIVTDPAHVHVRTLFPETKVEGRGPVYPDSRQRITSSNSSIKNQSSNASDAGSDDETPAEPKRSTCSGRAGRVT